MRAFVAIGLPDETRDTLEHLTAELGVGRAVPWENLHVTLAFLDDQPEAVLATLHDALCEIDLSPFDMRFRGLEGFGGRNPRLVCVAVEPSDALVALRNKVRTAARAAGIDLPRERFRPHVTLARFARSTVPQDYEKLGLFLVTHGGVRPDPVRVSAFQLVRSQLFPESPRYENLAEYELV